MVARVIPVEVFDLVVFGATGDLARRKILPALFRRFGEGQMPTGARIIGAARTELTGAEFRAMVSEALDEFIGADKVDAAQRDGFLATLDYVPVDAMGDGGWATLAGMPVPLLPLQILWLNLVTDTFPAPALALARKAGLDAPPATLDDFVAGSEAISQLEGKSGHCLRGGPGARD